MDHEKHWQRGLQYKPESWRSVEGRDQKSETRKQRSAVSTHGPEEAHPEVRDQTRVLELLGRINYNIIKGSRVYIEVGGVVYKTLYGGYWRSVFTGVEHYLFRCEQVSGSIWAEESGANTAVDLPIVYSNDGWTASGYSLSFMLSLTSDL
jgi:hypothetical protein